jgi:hypothetical protein
MISRRLWRIGATRKTIIMIRNGLYSVISKLLDDAKGGATGVSVLRDGTMLGGGPIYYHVGSYVCFSNRPFRVKHFQAIHQCGVDVARGLVLLSGIGTWALPSWDSRTGRNNLLGGLTVN